MSENLNRFKQVLNQIFEMDKAELDFGIYRIINQKRNEINSFLDNDLLPQVRNELSKYEDRDSAKVKGELKELIEDAEKLGADPESMPKIKELRKKLKDSVDPAALESEVFSSLATFFRRYYDKGDFISKRRYKEGVYAIPYEGEEVKLYWANHDQYYIKTTENLNNYTFKISDKKVHFRLVQGEQTKDNIKSGEEKNRKFVFNEEEKYEIKDGELYIFFNFKADTRNQTRTKSTKKTEFARHLNVSMALELLAEKEITKSFPELGNIVTSSTIPDLTILEKHLNDYTAKNSFDYFIHKDLGGFLRRELDFFIKNEVMHIDDLDTENELEVKQYLSKIKVIKRIGNKIITFLEQLENFQKKLWLKKKFVVKSEWCLTLDRVPEELYPEIIKNEEQIEEWKKLFAIDELTEPPVLKKEKKGKKAAPDEDEESLFTGVDESDDDSEDAELIEEDTLPEESPAAFVPYTEPLTLEFLKANPFLVLDTKFFDAETKWKILSSIEDIDEQCDGVLINSENFQALGLLQEKYKEKVKCVYIDPPYNTDSAPIIYKNNYRHSSWISLINDRLKISMRLLKYDGVKTIAIDDTEISNLSKIIENYGDEYRITRLTIVHNPKGSITKDFNRVHEYALFITREDVKDCIARILEKNDTPRKMRRWGENSLRTDRRLSFYPIYIKDNKVVRIGVVPDNSFHPESKNVKIDSGEIEIWPIDQDGIERRWNFGLDSINDNLDRITVLKVNDTYDLFLTHEQTVPKTVWSGGKYDAGNYGNTLLINILGKKLFDFPKSINLVKKSIALTTQNENNSLILDYFAGSGTTGHAVINLNREDASTGSAQAGSRKYILVEMGQYFDTVLKPRIQKVIYSKDWKDGKPVSRRGSSHIFKYMTLESYEDTLNNLSIDEKVLISDLPPLAREEYMLKYMLDLETKDSASLLNIDSMKDPFNYMLKIIHENELRSETIDLIETFNYLLGLDVKRYHAPETLLLNFEKSSDNRLMASADKKGELFTFQPIEGFTRDNETVLIIWRLLTGDAEKDDASLRYFISERFNLKDYGRVYINGDCTFNEVHLTEEHFKKLMFDVQDL